MIPVWGSGRDMINAIQTGDGWGVAINAGFLVWDVCSVVAGVFSFGAGTAAMQAGKMGIKAGIKAGAKQIGKKAVEQLGKAGFKHLSKKSIKEFTANIVCKIVKACFTGDTLIHTQNGTIPIRDIKIGDKVFSYDVKNNIITLRKVCSLYEEEVNEILEIETQNGVISTTRNHPFYVNGEFKDAEQIEIGEYLLTRDEELSEVISLNYVTTTTKVYNFEVEYDHCYFVCQEGILVLNACYKRNFFKAHPLLKGKVVVHHAVEQQVWKKWPGLFDDAFKHSLNNLRGIPKHLNNDLHLSKIRKEWNEFYRTFEKVTPSKEDVLEYAKYIDKKYGHLFDPPLK